MRHALIIVIVGVWSTVAFPTSVHAQEQCSPSDRTCATFPPLISPYDPEYLATTPEKIDGAGPGCVKGQTNPRLPGTCGPVGSATPGGDAAGAGESGSDTTGSGNTGEGGPGGVGAAAPAPPPPPPPPPTASEVLASCPDPSTPSIGVNPEQRGITGLETYLWASPASTLASGGTIRGYAVGCVVEPVRWTFTTGDGASYSRARHGGPAPDHVVEHIYDTRNEPDENYTLTLTVTWTRTTSLGRDTITTAASRPYHVVEVRSAPSA